MAEIKIPPPIGLLETDGYSAKANRVTSATSVTTTFEYEITHVDGSQTIQVVRDTDGDREVVEKKLPATAASKAAAKIDIPKPTGVEKVRIGMTDYVFARRGALPLSLVCLVPYGPCKHASPRAAVLRVSWLSV